MSRTDKTDPHRVKVARYGEHYWMRIHRCGCSICNEWRAEARAQLRVSRRKAERNWQREYA